MPTLVTMPQLGETVVEGTITRWLKNEGDTIERDEPLFEISTDKVDTEVPSPLAGTLVEIKVQEGETVGVGTELALIETDGAGSASSAESESAESEPPESEPAESEPARGPSGARAPPGARAPAGRGRRAPSRGSGCRGRDAGSSPSGPGGHRGHGGHGGQRGGHPPLADAPGDRHEHGGVHSDLGPR